MLVFFQALHRQKYVLKQYIAKMLDADLFAKCIGIVKHTPAATIMQVANELEINFVKAKYLLDQLEDCNLIVNFGEFYASTDLADLN